jgi:hypothetical protein
MLALAYGKTAPAEEQMSSVIKVVAGARNHLYLEFAWAAA